MISRVSTELIVELYCVEVLVTWSYIADKVFNSDQRSVEQRRLIHNWKLRQQLLLQAFFSSFFSNMSRRRGSGKEFRLSLSPKHKPMLFPEEDLANVSKDKAGQEPKADEDVIWKQTKCFFWDFV